MPIPVLVHQECDCKCWLQPSVFFADVWFIPCKLSAAYFHLTVGEALIQFLSCSLEVSAGQVSVCIGP